MGAPPSRQSGWRVLVTSRRSEAVLTASPDTISLAIPDDHVHLSVQAGSKYSSADIARQFTSYSGAPLWTDSRRSGTSTSEFWKIGYYVGTTGAVSGVVVERYSKATEHEAEYWASPPLGSRNPSKFFRSREAKPDVEPVEEVRYLTSFRFLPISNTIKIFYII
ncbi:transposase [Natribaculum luteum]|uniref:Transposase n=1 Tax=Natribaculum luteum TaxID=1586232 RepID=A0ABD5P0P7_9EURY